MGLPAYEALIKGVWGMVGFPQPPLSSILERELPPLSSQGAPSMAIPMATVMGTLCGDKREMRRENDQELVV